MGEIRQTKRAAEVLRSALDCCKEYRHEFVMPEHLLLALTDEENFSRAVSDYAHMLPFAEEIEEKL